MHQRMIEQRKNSLLKIKLAKERMMQGINETLERERSEWTQIFQDLHEEEWS